MTAAKVSVIGASGYTGAELLRLIELHPDLSLNQATGDSKAGVAISELYPSLLPAYGNRPFDTFDIDRIDGDDLVFCALPHGLSMVIVPELVSRVGKVVDLGSDFRLRDADLYPKWYGAEHSAPALLKKAAYGLPELFREKISAAELIATTGCNAATAILALTPFVAAGDIELTSLVVDIKTGVSGAGRPPKEATSFCAINDAVTPYGLLTHRHTPEIEQALFEASGLEASILFTPHLVPAARGILATCYGRRIDTAFTTQDALARLEDHYRSEPFVQVVDRPPSTSSVRGANQVHVTARVDDRTGMVMGIAVLDNLMKGASGMAIQCANLALGFEETAGLSMLAVYP